VAVNLDAGGGEKRVVPQMNVTPLVDVVLVLLIIFMVITPLLTKNFWVHTPKQEKEEVERQQLDQDPTPPLVLRVGADRAVNVNGADVPFAELAERLRRMFAAREDHILFFDAADDAEYGFAVEVMDQAREGGAITIAALTTALQAGMDGARSGASPPAPEAAPATP
jgi:biopolymer transport protein ExbD/biopolymer transport protein TolR